MGDRNSFSGGEADQSPPSRAEVEYAWNCTSAPQYAFMVRCPVKKRHLFVNILHLIRRIGGFVPPRVTHRLIGITFFFFRQVYLSYLQMVHILISNISFSCRPIMKAVGNVITIMDTLGLGRQVLFYGPQDSLRLSIVFLVGPSFVHSVRNGIQLEKATNYLSIFRFHVTIQELSKQLSNYGIITEKLIVALLVKKISYQFM
jgi:hypothetical protein